VRIEEKETPVVNKIYDQKTGTVVNKIVHFDASTVGLLRQQVWKQIVYEMSSQLEAFLIEHFPGRQIGTQEAVVRLMARALIKYSARWPQLPCLYA